MDCVVFRYNFICPFSQVKVLRRTETGGAIKEELQRNDGLSCDGVHPTEEGYFNWIIEPALRAINDVHYNYRAVSRKRKRKE